MSPDLTQIQLLTCEELADLTRISRSAIRKACSTDPGRVKVTLPKITRIGTRVRFRADHVQEWLDSLTEKTDVQQPPPTFGFNPDSTSPRRRGRPRKQNAFEMSSGRGF